MVLVLVDRLANLLFLSWKSSFVQHQRSRSASATVFRPGYEDGLLKPSSIRAPVAGYSRIITHAPSRVGYHSEFPPRYRFSGADTVARMDRSGYGAVGPAYAQQVQRPSRTPAAMMGNYAQIDPQSTIYQRRTSSGSSVTSSVGSKDTFDAILASPTSSRTSFESWHSASRQPEHGWQRPTPIKQYRRKKKEGELFAQLPEEVLALILQNLKESHLKPGSSSCATCMMRDLGSVAISAKKLLKVARIALYVIPKLILI